MQQTRGGGEYYQGATSHISGKRGAGKTKKILYTCLVRKGVHCCPRGKELRKNIPMDHDFRAKPFQLVLRGREQRGESRWSVF